MPWEFNHSSIYSQKVNVWIRVVPEYAGKSILTIRPGGHFADQGYLTFRDLILDKLSSFNLFNYEYHPLHKPRANYACSPDDRSEKNYIILNLFTYDDELMNTLLNLMREADDLSESNHLAFVMPLLEMRRSWEYAARVGRHNEALTAASSAWAQLDLARFYKKRYFEEPLNIDLMLLAFKSYEACENARYTKSEYLAVLKEIVGICDAQLSIADCQSALESKLYLDDADNNKISQSSPEQLLEQCERLLISALLSLDDNRDETDNVRLNHLLKKKGLIDPPSYNDNCDLILSNIEKINQQEKEIAALKAQLGSLILGSNNNNATNPNMLFSNNSTQGTARSDHKSPGLSSPQ